MNEGQNLKNIHYYTENIRKTESWPFVWRPLYKVQGKYFLTFLFNKTKTSSMHNNRTLNPYDTSADL